MHRACQSSRTSICRQGFTLPELLVVIAIVGILTALSVGAVFRFMGTQQTSTTRTLLFRLDSRLHQQIGFIRDRFSGSPSPLATSLAAGDQERSKVIHKKLVLKQFFPTSFAEVFNPGGIGSALAPRPAYLKYLRDHGVTAAPTTAQTWESAACLYMVLRYGPETTGEDELGLSGSIRIISGFPCLVDGWGNPLIFCRWPTGVPSPVGAGPQNGFNDPFDPKGMLTAQAWLSLPERNQFQAIVHPVPNRGAAGPVSQRLYPVIASAGKDGKPGVDLRTLAILNATEASDNLYSIDVR